MLRREFWVAGLLTVGAIVLMTPTATAEATGNSDPICGVNTGTCAGDAICVANLNLPTLAANCDGNSVCGVNINQCNDGVCGANIERCDGGTCGVNTGGCHGGVCIVNTGECNKGICAVNTGRCGTCPAFLDGIPPALCNFMTDPELDR